MIQRGKMKLVRKRATISVKSDLDLEQEFKDSNLYKALPEREQLKQTQRNDSQPMISIPLPESQSRPQIRRIMQSMDGPDRFRRTLDHPIEIPFQPDFDMSVDQETQTSHGNPHILKRFRQTSKPFHIQQNTQLMVLNGRWMNFSKKSLQANNLRLAEPRPNPINIFNTAASQTLKVSELKLSLNDTQTNRHSASTIGRVVNPSFKDMLKQSTQYMWRTNEKGNYSSTVVDLTPHRKRGSCSQYESQAKMPKVIPRKPLKPRLDLDRVLIPKKKQQTRKPTDQSSVRGWDNQEDVHILLIV